MLKLSSYIAALGEQIAMADCHDNPIITAVTNDSRQVKPGAMFVAINGAKQSGYDYIDNAIAAGAVAIIHDQPLQLPPTIGTILVKDSYTAYAIAMEHFYHYPADQLRLSVITGTNGKTTTAYMLHQLLRQAEYPCGLISTVEYSSMRQSIAASRTTPEAAQLQQLFTMMLEDGCRDVVMEASSHGLLQHRLGRTRCHTAIFTNLTGDHLDYHHTLDNYFAAKALLFTDYLATDGTAVINRDDPRAEELLRLIGNNGKVITYGKHSTADMHIGNIHLQRDRSCFDLSCNGTKRPITLLMPGEHNIYNFTAAAAAALTLGINWEQLINSTRQPFAVPGRLELLQCPGSPAIYVDYAHTDDALKNILQTLNAIKQGRIITLFGCGGDRDKSKRPRMGKVAAQLSDLIILTNDNPRTEAPDQILQDIAAGIDDDIPFEIIPDRYQAIARALELARAEDLVLIAGKGHETKQEQQGKFIPFDDRQVTRQLLKKLFPVQG